MTDKMENILIIGATSGLGESLARALHAQGKKLILTGRRTERLQTLKEELSGTDIVTWDIADLSALGTTVTSILKDYPSIDTVLVNSALMQAFSLLDVSPDSSSISIPTEVTTNITAPFILAHHFIPHLAAIASQGKQAAFLITSSGLGFTPLGFWPVYSASKAAVHAFMIALRHQVAQSSSEAIKANLNIVEIVPPYVESTGLGESTRDSIAHIMKNAKGITVKEWTDETIHFLGQRGENGKMLYEIGAGDAKDRVAQWREGPGTVYKKMGIDA